MADVATTAGEYLDFTGAVVLVTGAGTGIGAAVARGFGRLGATVAVHYNSSADGAAAVVDDIGGDSFTVQADLTTLAGAQQLVDEVVNRVGALHVVVNNAGDMVQRVPIADLDDETYRRILDVNVTSMFGVCKAAIPHLRAAGRAGVAGPSIVNLTSVAARTGGGGGAVMYATSKGAVSTYTRGLAKELASEGVRVNALAPGLITTPFHDRHTTDDQMSAMSQTIPMARPGEPDECVGAVLFLASESMAGYVTGQIIEVNGGQFMP